MSRGSSAVVYKGFDPSREGTVLLKVLTAEAAEDPKLVKWFEQEAEVVASIEHSNVVALFDSGLHESRPYLVTEFVEGGSLKEAIQRFGSFPAELAAFVIKECAGGLSAAHKVGVLHSDLKPANVLLGYDGSVRIADFGLATRIGEEGHIRGTPGYLAPEIIAGDPPTESSDLFALGVMFAELLTGRALFLSDDTSVSLDKTLNFDPVPLLLADPRIPESLHELLAALLSREPTDRLYSAAELASHLSELLADSKGLLHADQSRLAEFLADSEGYVATRAAGLETAGAAEDREEIVAGKTGRRWPGRVAIWGSIVGVLLVGLLGINIFGPRLELLDEPFPSGADTLLASNLDLSIDPRGVAEGQAAEGLEGDEPEELEVPGEGAQAGDNGDTVAETGLPLDTARMADGRTTSQNVPDNEPVRSHGALQVSVNPWADVYVDGVRIGQTPLRNAISLPVGQHRIELRNPEFPTITRSVNIEADETTRATYSLWDHVARIRFDVFPYADVTVNGQLIGTVPPHRTPIILTPGEHSVRLSHPTLGTWSGQISVRAGENRSIRYKLDELLQNGSM
ncbi:MAG: serine/threonine-protein kinase [Rubricoccaceae bacterium]|nr:serine/threonine-protein kinase [Rubricoccaceae bacterium]